MATDKVGFIPSKNSQNKLLEYIQRIIAEHRKHEDYFQKMEVIDIAYARYVASKDPYTGVARGDGIDAATQPVGVVGMPSTTPPIIVSQVDTMVGYLAEVFLSGYPLFPIVSSPANVKKAEQLETLLDDHATIGGYARQLLKFLKAGVKYNVCALEADWTAIEQYTSMDLLLEPGKQTLKKDNKSYTKLKALDMYNTIWDRTISPGDVAMDGDYAGYVELNSRTKLKRFLNRLANDDEAFNIREALNTGVVGAATDSAYRIHPQISDYVTAKKPLSGMNWMEYLGGKDYSKSSAYSENFEKIVLYVRIIPADFEMTVPAPNTPQIFKLIVINQKILVQVKRVISAYDFLPILFGQPIEDHLDYQTQSIAEASIPFQEAAKTLFNIRFNAARRAVSDRALYDPMLINPDDINAPVPAAKIPVKANSLDSNKTLANAYMQIPFDARGTETALQDGMMLSNWGKELSGQNSPTQGQFQKGNKSVTEWNDTMGGSDARLRLPALTLEYQVFMPLKEILKLNILQNGADAIIISQKTGEEVNININELRQAVLSFRVGDGYTPKSKLASTEFITALFQFISSSPFLQAQYGPALPAMFAHMAQLGGVRGLEEYSKIGAQNTPQAASATLPGATPQAQAQAQAVQQPPTA